MRPFVRALAAAVVASMFVFSSTSCTIGGSSGSSNSTTVVRLFDALVCSTMTSVDLAQGNNTSFVFEGVQYGTMDGPGFVFTNSGTQVQNFLMQASTSNAAAPQIAYDQLANEFYTFIASGDCTQTSGTYAPKLLSFHADPPTFSSLNSANQAAVRLINVAPTADASVAAVDLYGNGTAFTGASNIAYAADSGYNTVTAGKYTITLHTHANGNNVTLPSGTVSNLTNYSLTAGHTYTFIVTGQVANSDPTRLIDVKAIEDQ